jgi:hypothetical protein
MPEPILEQIIANRETALKGISVGSGYHTDAGQRVKRQRQELMDVPSGNMPCLFLFWADLGDEARISSTPGTHRTKPLVVVLGYVSGVDTDKQLARLEADIFKAMLTDHRCGDLAVNTVYLGANTDVSEFAPKKRGWIASRFQIEYKRTHASP